MDSTPGQRLLTALVDIAFFILVGVLAYHHVLDQASILPILLMYARERFAVAQQKQWVQMVGPGSGGGTPSGRPPPASTAGTMPPPAGGPPDSQGRINLRRMSIAPAGLIEIIRSYVRHPPSIAVAAITAAAIVVAIHGCGSQAMPAHPIPAAVVAR